MRRLLGILGLAILRAFRNYLYLSGLLRWFWLRKNVLWDVQLWAGLFPAAILAYLALVTLRQTNQQLKLLSEEVSYVREPVLILKTEPEAGRGIFTRTLYLKNIGNEPAANVSLRFGLFLVNDNNIFSYGEIDNFDVQVGNSKTPAKRTLWPFLTIPPDSNWEFSQRIRMLHRKPLVGNILNQPDSIVDKQFYIVNDLLKGEFVLFVEYAYRRRSDYIQRTDTAYYFYDPMFGLQDNVKLTVGGMKIINRIRDYLQNGPPLSIFISMDRVAVYRQKPGPFVVFLSAGSLALDEAAPSLVYMFRKNTSK